MDVLSILSSLSATTKKNEKIAILEQYKNSELLQLTLKYALCPHIQFNIKKIPEYTPNNGSTSLLTAINLFKDNLVDRGITGSIAKTEFLRNTLNSVSASDAEVLVRIIKKDLRAGVAEGIVNKVFPGLIPPWPCLLAESYDAKTIKKINFPAICQLKSDGTRINIVVNNGVVTYYGRSGKVFDFLGIPDKEFIDLANQIGLDSVMFDGECLVTDVLSNSVLKRETGNGIISRALKGTITENEAKSVVFDLWDFVPYSEFNAGKDTTPYITRYTKLKTAVDSAKTHYIRLIETHIVNSLDEAFNIYEWYLAARFEGAVLKNFSTVWEDKRSKDQIKLKAEKECEVIVVAINPGNGKYAGLIGSLACRTADGVVVDVSGFTDEFRALPESEVLGKIITVRYNTITEDSKTKVKSLFLPRFVELRHDKTEPDSIL